MDLFQSVAYPSELWALFRFKFGGGKETIMPTLDYVSETQNNPFRPEIVLKRSPLLLASILMNT